MFDCKFYFVFIFFYHDFFFIFWTFPREARCLSICLEHHKLCWKPFILPVNKQRFCCRLIDVFSFLKKKFFKKKVFLISWFLFLFKLLKIFFFVSFLFSFLRFNHSKSSPRRFCVLLKFIIIYLFHRIRYQSCLLEQLNLLKNDLLLILAVPAGYGMQET